VYYFGLVRGPGVPGVPGVVPLWARDDRRAASIRLDLAGFANPIDTILGRYGVLGLTGDQITRLREVAASSNSFALPELERARNILTASQWYRLSTEGPSAVTIRTQASSASPSPPPSPPSRPSSSSQRPVRVNRPDVTLYTGVSTVYETNLTHAPAGLDAYGVLLGVGGDFRYRSRHTTLEAQYDGVFRRYTGTDLWNVPGHEASVAVSHRVARRWAVGAEAGIQLNGSSEDRVLRNEYTAEANLEYRLTGASRVELYSVYMLKRYPNPTGNNASDPRVGLKYRRVLGASGTWGVGGRYDYNGADSSRYRYNAYTATSDVGFPVRGSSQISSSLRYNIRRYVSRLITVGAGKELRRDADFVATLAWRQGIARVWDVVASYRYEYYRSNDPDHTFRDDMVTVALTRYW
jgi:hypothetical protein